MKKYFWGIATGIAVMLLVPLAILATGIINMGASTRPSSLEETLAELALQTSMYWRAPAGENPVAGDVAAREAGLIHYRAMCVRCHGGPGVNAQSFSEGMNPAPPSLEQAKQNFSESELFWIVKHGIRMTGMPAFGPSHDDADIWKIVEGVKALDNLTAEETSLMKEGQKAGEAHADHDHAHGGGEAGEREHSHEGESRTEE
jgi:mono/diheme cytochrome c family protein